MKCQKRLLTGIILLSIGIVLQIISRTVSGFGEWYSTNIYPCFVRTIGKVMGLIPFSVAEIGVYILVTCLIGMVVRLMQKKDFRNFLANIFALAAILFFVYCVNCGVNYYRTPFAESSGFGIEKYSVNDLRNTCMWLTKQLNQQALDVSRDEKGIMCLSVEEKEEASRVMSRLGDTYQELAGDYPCPKSLLNHWILSVQSLSGVYSPFTVEANYNSGMTDYNIPFTACHELSHLKGFMQEEEANFIAFLACLESDTADFQYSGYMLAWIHCTNLLYKVDYEAWEEVRAGLSEKVVPDLKANSAFWDKYDGKVAEVANKINDTYLKANGQHEGVESYGRMADLIVSYCCKKGLL